VAILQEDLVGNILPTAYISKITLESYSAPKRPGDNPHILDPELVEQSPPSTPPGQVKVILDLVINEVLIDNFITKWFGDDFLRKYAKVSVIQSRDARVSALLSSSKNAILAAKQGYSWVQGLPLNDDAEQIFEPMPLDQIPAVFSEFVETKTIDLQFDAEGISQSLVDKLKVKNQDGNSVVKINFKTFFNLQEEKPEHLSYFVVSTLDMEAVAQDYGLSLQFAANSVNNITGEVRSDTVFDRSQLINNTFAFFTKDGKSWPGPVRYSVQNDSWTTDPANNISPQPLIVKTFPNAKVQDFRNFSEVEKLKIDLSFTENVPSLSNGSFLSGQETNFASKNDKLIQEKRRNYFSDILLSRTPDGSTRFAFSFDILNLFRDQSRFAKLYDMSLSAGVKSALANSEIKQMKLLRRRITYDKKVNQLGTPTTGEQVFDEETPPTVLGLYSAEQNITGEPPVASFQNSSASMKSYKLTSKTDDVGMFYFTGQDLSISQVTDGIYQYGVEMQVEDAGMKYLYNLLRRLNNDIRYMNLYYQRSIQLGVSRFILPDDGSTTISDTEPHINTSFATSFLLNNNDGNYNPLANRFTKKFKDMEINKYSPASDAPWIRPIKTYLTALNFLVPAQTFVNIFELYNSMISVCHPCTGNPQGLLNVLGIISRFAKNLDNLISPVQEQESDRRPTLNGTNQSSIRGQGYISNIITVRKWFSNEEHDSNMEKNYGYDYLLTPTENSNLQPNVLPSDGQPGLVYVTKEAYAARAAFETKKYYNSANPDISDIFSGDSVLTTNFSYFSPNYCYLGDEVKQLISVSPQQAQDPTNFNNSSGVIKPYDYDYYSIIEAKIARFNARNVPVLKEQAFPTESSSLDAQIYKKTITGLLSDVGLRLESSDEELSVPLTDQNIAPSLKQQKQNKLAQVQKVDPLEPEKLLIPEEPEGKMSNVNPNTLFLGIARPYLNSGYMNHKAYMMDKYLVGSTSKQSSIGSYDSFSLNAYNINYSKNVIARWFGSPEQRSQLAYELNLPTLSTSLSDLIPAMPNQIKSLFSGSKAISSSEVISNLFNLVSSFNTETGAVNDDPLKNPKYISFFNFRYAMLNRVEVLEGFTKGPGGRTQNPIWIPLTQKVWQSFAGLGGEYLICRMIPFKLSAAGLKKPKSVDLPIYNKYFLLQPPPAPEGSGQGPQEDPETDPETDPEIQELPDKELDIIPDPEDTSNNIIIPGGNLPNKYCPPYRKQQE
jgi:hypothetical protein